MNSSSKKYTVSFIFLITAAVGMKYIYSQLPDDTYKGFQFEKFWYTIFIIPLISGIFFILLTRSESVVKNLVSLVVGSIAGITCIIISVLMIWELEIYLNLESKEYIPQGAYELSIFLFTLAGVFYKRRTAPLKDLR